MVLRLQYFLLLNKHARSLWPSMFQRAIIGQNSLKFVSHLVLGKKENISDKYSPTSVEDYLINVGANMEKVYKEVKISKLELCEKLKLVVDILEEQCNLEAIDVGRMVTKRPRILLLSQEQIEKTIKMLRDIGLKQEDIMLMFKRSPGILTNKIEKTLEEKSDVLYNLNVLPPFNMKDVLKIITKCPALVYTCTPSSLNDKVNFLLKELGFYRRQLRNMILKQPAILTFSQETMKSKFDYCYKHIGVSIPDIARCPRVWQCSLKRLKGRHMFLKHLNVITEHTHVDDFGLGKIVTPSDEMFVKQIANTSAVEFQNFIKEIGNK